MDLGLDFLDVAKLGGKAEDGAGGAEAELRVRVVQDFAELKSGLKGKALEVALGELGGLALLLGVLRPEIGVLEPTVQGAAADLRKASGLGDGGCGGDYGEGGFLTRGESGSLFCRAIVRHFEPWGLSGRLIDSAGVIRCLLTG